MYLMGWIELSSTVKHNSYPDITCGYQIPDEDLPGLENPLWTVLRYVLHPSKTSYDDHYQTFVTEHVRDERGRLLDLCETSDEVVIWRLPEIFKRFREEEPTDDLSPEQQQEFQGI